MLDRNITSFELDTEKGILRINGQDLVHSNWRSLTLEIDGPSVQLKFEGVANGSFVQNKEKAFNSV